MSGSAEAAQPLENDEDRQLMRRRVRQKASHSCQFCGKDLEAGGRYHKRYRICPEHMMAGCLEVDGLQQRFCQQCGRFHLLAEFEGDKRSCRDQLGKQALRRRLARRAAAALAPRQSGGPSGCGSGSSAAERTGGHVPLQQEVQAQQLFAAVEARAEAAAAAPVPWLEGGVMSQQPAAAQQLAALLIQQQQQQAQQPQRQQPQRQQPQRQQSQRHQSQRQSQPVPPAPAPEQPQQQLLPAQAAMLPLPQPLLMELVRQQQADQAQHMAGHAPSAQQQLLQAYGSDHSSHSMLALARAASAGAAAALPSPLAPITPPSAEDEVAPLLQQAAVALLPALSQPSLAPLLQAVMAVAPPSSQLQSVLAPPPLPPCLPPVPQLQPVPQQLQSQAASLHLPAQQALHHLPPQPVPLQLPPQLPPQLALPGALVQQLLAANQQRHVAQQRAQRSEDELAALLRAIVHFLTALCGTAQAPQPADA